MDSPLVTLPCNNRRTARSFGGDSVVENQVLTSSPRSDSRRRESRFSRSEQQREKASPDDFQHRIGGIERRKVATAAGTSATLSAIRHSIVRIGRRPMSAGRQTFQRD